MRFLNEGQMRRDVRLGKMRQPRGITKPWGGWGGAVGMLVWERRVMKKKMKMGRVSRRGENGILIKDMSPWNYYFLRREGEVGG